MGGYLFSIIIEESTELLIAFYDIEQKKLLQRILEPYDYKNCDYFIYLNADRNSNIMFSGMLIYHIVLLTMLMN